MEKYIFIFKVMCLSLFGVLNCSCVLDDSGGYEKKQILRIELPLSSLNFTENKNACNNLVFWKIQVRGKNIKQDFILEGGQDYFEVETEKNKLLSVIALPVTKGLEGGAVSFYRQCGGIYPFEKVADSGENTVKLTWESGYGAWIFNLLYDNGLKSGFSEDEVLEFLSRFNWYKFLNLVSEKVRLSLEECRENENAVFYNPWLCDTQKMLENLSGGKFTALLLNTKDCFLVESNQELLFSSFVPENFLLERETVTVKKGEPHLFLVNQDYGLLLQGDSPKNVLRVHINLPIFTEDI